MVLLFLGWICTFEWINNISSMHSCFIHILYVSSIPVDVNSFNIPVKINEKRNLYCPSKLAASEDDDELRGQNILIKVWKRLGIQEYSDKGDQWECNHDEVLQAFGAAQSFSLCLSLAPTCSGSCFFFFRKNKSWSVCHFQKWRKEFLLWF